MLGLLTLQKRQLRDNLIEVFKIIELTMSIANIGSSVLMEAENIHINFSSRGKHRRAAAKPAACAQNP